MALYGYQPRLLRQPGGLVRINEKHWLARDLVFAHTGLQAFVFGRPVAEPSDSLPRRAQAGTGNDALTNSIGWVPNDTGYQYYSSDFPLTFPLSLSAWWHGISAGSDTGILSVRRTVTTDPGGLSLVRSSSERVVAESRTGATGAVKAWATLSYSSGRWQHGVAVFESDSMRRAYADGGNAASETTTRSLPADCTSIVLARTLVTSAAGSFIEGIALPIVVAAVLGPDLVQRLWQEQRSNPWVLFAERPILVPVSASTTAPTLLVASAHSITSTQATPRVTFTR